MKLQDFINLCADEDILLLIFDDESGEEILPKIWKSEYTSFIPQDIQQREVDSFYHTEDGHNLVMEIYVK